MRFQEGKLPEALKLAEEALATYRRLYPADRFPAPRADYARCVNGVGFLHFTLKDYARAVPPYLEALAMRRKLFPAVDGLSPPGVDP